VVEELIGDGLVRIGAMTPQQVRKVLALQKAGDARRFGEIAIELGFVDDAAIVRYIKSRPSSS
jgi:hypothetical protein